MKLDRQQVAPPSSWEDFEVLCHALFQEIWNDPAAQRNGRNGQEQSGVDIFGTNHAQGGGLWGVQCKGRNELVGSRLRTKDVIDELVKAEKFRPPLKHWIIATTSERDAALQEYVRLLSAKRQEQGKFSISIFSWDDLLSQLARFPKVARRMYPERFSNGKRESRHEFHLPPVRQTAFFCDPSGRLPALRELLSAGSERSADRVRKVVVHGMGGVGKTQLALRYCSEFRSHYAGIWWFAAERTQALEEECRLFCSRPGIEVVGGETASVAMRDWLASRRAAARGWLLVYDNAGPLKELMPFLPHGGPHHTLITTRFRPSNGVKQIALKAWTSADACKFLLQRLSDADAEELAPLADELDGLPLALEQAGAFLEKTRTPVKEYVERIREQQEPGLLAREDSDYCDRSVRATLSASFSELSMDARMLLQLCCWLAPLPIPEELFTSKPDMPVKFTPVIRVETPEFREVAAELEGLSLCQVIELQPEDPTEAPSQALFFHRLTQSAVRMGCDPGVFAVAAMTLLSRRSALMDKHAGSYFVHIMGMSEHRFEGEASESLKQLQTVLLLPIAIAFAA